MIRKRKVIKHLGAEEDYGTTGVQPELSGDAALAAINSGLSADEQIRKTEVNTIYLDKPLPTNML